MKRLTTLALGAVVLASFFDNFSQFPIVAPYARALGAGPAVVGVVVAAYSATNLVGNVLAGYLIDRLGRKRLLVGGLLAAAVAVLLYAAARNPSQLIVVRAVHGLAAAILAPAAFTLMGDLFPRERRGQAMGINGALIALAAMLAPGISGVVRDRWGFDAVFVAVAALLIVAALTAQLLVAETQSLEARRRPARKEIIALATRRPLLLAYAAAISLTFGMGTLVTYMPLRLADLGFRAAQTGSAFSAFALLAMGVMVSPLSRIGDRRGRLGPIGVGLSIIGLSLLLLSGATQLIAILASMALYGVGFGLIFPAANAQVADATQAPERGTAFGLFYAFYSVGVVVGALASGFLARQDASSLLNPFVVAGALALLIGPTILVWGRASVERAAASPVGRRH